MKAYEDKIHFLNTGHSDCIILESRGRFAMVDAGEDTEFPADKPHLNLKGYEDEVVNYLLKNCRGENGRVTLDFAVGTHAHSDHIGGFDTVILHPEIEVKKAYLKPYNGKNVFIMERMRWDNEEVYSQMLSALKKENAEIVESFEGEEASLGNFKITFFNGENEKRFIKYGENINSVVMLIENDGTRVLLAGDINSRRNKEKKIAEKIGKVNLLKVGHHGYPGSTTRKFAKILSPEYAVITNSMKAVYPHIRRRLEKGTGTKLFATADEKGVIAFIGKKGEIRFKTDIM